MLHFGIEIRLGIFVSTVVSRTYEIDLARLESRHISATYYLKTAVIADLNPFRCISTDFCANTVKIKRCVPCRWVSACFDIRYL